MDDTDAAAVVVALSEFGSQWHTNNNNTNQPTADSSGGGEHPDVVRLNVGGRFYMTCADTLQREPNSLFAQLIGAGHDGLEASRKWARRFRNGTFFLDRDGELFAYILDYLRTGKLLLPEGFRELARLREEVEFYRLETLKQLLMPYYSLKYPSSSAAAAAAMATKLSLIATPSLGMNNGGGAGALMDGGKLQRPATSTGASSAANAAAAAVAAAAAATAANTTAAALIVNPLYETGGFITLSYRGTFAFGRDGQSDIKFRKLNRILVCGKIALCREVFGDTLNESRDPDREGTERYTSRLYLKHQCLERACDSLAEKGFRMITSCSSGANGLASIASSQTVAQWHQSASVQDIMNPRSSGDLEEQRWAHYTEFVFYREPQFNALCCSSPLTTPRASIVKIPSSIKLSSPAAAAAGDKLL